ncbi:Transmembrane osmosensor [Serendipita sp. 399]|nr:Transmembrane osmosensor [Serendipita sp. 399]
MEMAQTAPGSPTQTAPRPASTLQPLAAVTTEPAAPSQPPLNPPMAPRRGEGLNGLDFTPLVTHYLFLVTFVLAGVGWLTAFIGQAAFEAKFPKVNAPQAGTLWFGIFLHLAVILGVLYTLATDNIALNRLQISVFSAISIVYAVQGVNTGLFIPLAAANAMGAGYLLLSFVFILWTLYFSAEEGSITLDLFNSLGTGGLTGPGRRRTIIGGQGVTRSATNMNNNAYEGYGSPHAPSNKIGFGPGSGIGGGPGGALGGPLGGGPPIGGGSLSNPVRSQNSLSRPEDAQSMTSMGARSAAGGLGPPGSTGAPPQTANTDVSAPLMTGASEPTSEQHYAYRAKALYNYKASDEDPNEISFSKGELLDILDNSGKWWQARKADGSTGIAPSNYLQMV